MSKKCTPFLREALFEVKSVEKVHAVVVRSTFEVKVAKHHMLGALLEVEMSKKCTPFWCEAS